MKPPQDNTPPAGLTTLCDVMAWHNSLLVLHARLACHFARPEPFARALQFVQGILSTLEHKNGWQLAEQAREATPYGMQRLLSQAGGERLKRMRSKRGLPCSPGGLSGFLSCALFPLFPPLPEFSQESRT